MLNDLIDAYPEEQFLIATGFDDAIIGIDVKTMRVIYSVQKCIDILINEHEMTDTDALEYFDFNVAGAHFGEKTPIWCYDY
jgi:hypothetical protein